MAHCQPWNLTWRLMAFPWRLRTTNMILHRRFSKWHDAEEEKPVGSGSTKVVHQCPRRAVYSDRDYHGDDTEKGILRRMRHTKQIFDLFPAPRSRMLPTPYPLQREHVSTYKFRPTKAHSVLFRHRTAGFPLTALIGFVFTPKQSHTYPPPNSLLLMLLFVR